MAPAVPSQQLQDQALAAQPVLFVSSTAEDEEESDDLLSAFAPIDTTLSEEASFDRIEELRRAHKDHAGDLSMAWRIKIRGKSWPSVKKDCKDFVKNCRICQLFNSRPASRLPMLVKQQAGVFEELQVDLLVPSLSKAVKAASNDKYLLVAVCSLTGYVILRPIPSKSADVVANALISIFVEYGPPKVIRSDHGGEFTARLCKSVFRLFNSKHRLGFAGIKRATGVVERKNRDVRSLLAKLLAEFDQPVESWPQFVFFTQWFLNTRFSRPIQTSPFYAVHARHAPDIFEDVLDVEEEDPTNPTPRISLAEWFALRNYHRYVSLPAITSVKQTYVELYANTYNAHPAVVTSPFKIGSYVRFMDKKTSKLDPVWSSPMCVVHHNSRGYKLRHPGGKAAQIAPARYPHDVLSLCADQAAAKKIDDDTIYVADIRGRRTYKGVDGATYFEFLITPLGSSDQIWVRHLEASLVAAYDAVRMATPKSKVNSAMYVVNIDYSKHIFLSSDIYVDSEAESDEEDDSSSD